MKTIAILLFILGIALIAVGVAIFFLTDCREVYRELRTTKRVQKDSGIDTAAQEIYYSRAIAYNNDEPPEQKSVKKLFRKNTPHVAVDDTAVLAAAAEAQKSQVVKQRMPAFEENKVARAAESQPGRIDRTKPLVFQPSGTAPLTDEKITAFHQKKIAETAPLRESISETAPLGISVSETAPLSSRKIAETEPLTQKGGRASAEEESLGRKTASGFRHI